MGLQKKISLLFNVLLTLFSKSISFLRRDNVSHPYQSPLLSTLDLNMRTNWRRAHKRPPTDCDVFETSWKFYDRDLLKTRRTSQFTVYAAPHTVCTSDELRLTETTFSLNGSPTGGRT
jgi:hypothetical protein